MIRQNLTSLIIVKVTLKKTNTNKTQTFIILIYFVVCMFGMSAPSLLRFGVDFLGRTALLLKEDLISGYVPPRGLRVVCKKRKKMQEWNKKCFSFGWLLRKFCVS